MFRIWIYLFLNTKLRITSLLTLGRPSEKYFNLGPPTRILPPRMGTRSATARKLNSTILSFTSRIPSNNYNTKSTMDIAELR